MSERMKTGALVVALSCAGLCTPGCTGDNAPGDEGQTSWEALMTDGDPMQIAPGAMRPMPPPPGPPSGGRFCPNGDCSGSPLALWTFDDCNASNTGLADTAFTSIPHPAFRSVSAACAAGIAGAAVKLATDEDIVYSPDQPDYVFDQGLTVAAWIKPDDTARRASRASASKGPARSAGDGRARAGARAQAHQRQDRRCLRGRAGRRPVHARRRHVRRQGRDALRRRRPRSRRRARWARSRRAPGRSSSATTPTGGCSRAPSFGLARRAGRVRGRHRGAACVRQPPVVSADARR